MPQIIFKAVTEQTVAAISTDLTAQLSQIIDTPEEWFSVEYHPHVFYCKGEKVAHTPMVQVWWFERGQETQDLVAVAIDRLLREQGYTHIEISFHPLERPKYYENGEHY